MLGKGCRLRVFENKLQRRIFLPKREDVMKGWKKLYNKELHSLFYTSDIIRMINSEG
jgi:hypothetical protein